MGPIAHKWENPKHLKRNVEGAKTEAGPHSTTAVSVAKGGQPGSASDKDG